MIAGIVCFFFDSLSAGGMLGNMLAIASGLAYAGVFLLKESPRCDFECAAILGFAACFVVGIPFYPQETVFTFDIALTIVALGVVQLGLAYLFLSKGLDAVSPVTASLDVYKRQSSTCSLASSSPASASLLHLTRSSHLHAIIRCQEQ